MTRPEVPIMIERVGEPTLALRPSVRSFINSTLTGLALARDSLAGARARLSVPASLAPTRPTLAKVPYLLLPNDYL